MPEAFSWGNAEDIRISPKFVTKITFRIDFALLIFISLNFHRLLLTL